MAEHIPENRRLVLNSLNKIYVAAIRRLIEMKTYGVPHFLEFFNQRQSLRRQNIIEVRSQQEKAYHEYDRELSS